jgi:putative NADPH-quinone reductase
MGVGSAPEVARLAACHAWTMKKRDPRRILIIQGHPDPSTKRFCRALARSYEDGAREGGHEVRVIDVARLEFPILRTREEFEKGEVPIGIRNGQEWIQWANHLVVIYPLWLGTLPALLKGFFEQTFRYGFSIGSGGGKLPVGLLKGRSARIVVTMGMPAIVYRVFFGAHGLKSLVSGVLKLAGIAPLHSSLIGLIEGRNDKFRAGWLEKMRKLGRDAK